MKERPILFKAEMVRAILNGTKTQTRRAVKDRHIDAAPPACFFQWLRERCPYGQPGDRLWVRETWQGPLLEEGGDYPDGYYTPEFCEYAADGGPAPEFVTPDGEEVQRWRPSIHMPRWASRITLEIVSVRVERLQDISEADALAEGVTKIRDACHVIKGFDYDLAGLCHTSAITPFAKLWDSINGPDAWQANPWVWVVEFRRVES